MNIIFGTKIHRAQLVMNLDISKLDESRIANKIMQHKPAISIQHFNAGGPTDDAAVIIWNGKTPVEKIIGKWELHKAVDNGVCYTNYLRFTPMCGVKSCALETVDVFMDEYYLYYTFNDYKKL